MLKAGILDLGFTEHGKIILGSSLRNLDSIYSSTLALSMKQNESGVDYMSFTNFCSSQF